MADQRAHKRYSDKQVALILQRATEITAKEAPTSGFSLDDLERIAVEAGLDPAAVRRAAAEVDAGSVPTSRWPAFLGGPTRVLFEARLDGELSAPAHERIVELLQRHLPAGTPSVIGRTLTWQLANPQGRQVGVRLSSRDGFTTVRVEEPLGNLIGGIYGGVGGGVGGSLMPLLAIGASLALGPLAIAPALALGLVGSYGLTRSIYGAASRRRQAALQSLFDELCAAVAAEADEARAKGELRAEDLEAVRARTLPSRAVAEAAQKDEQITVDEVVPGLRRR